LARLMGNRRESLEKFRMIIQRDRIRAAVRSQLFKGKEESRIIVFLNKQVAYVGHVSFSAPEGESPLGPIRLEIQTADLVGIIVWMIGGPLRRQGTRIHIALMTVLIISQ